MAKMRANKRKLSERVKPAAPSAPVAPTEDIVEAVAPSPMETATSAKAVADDKQSSISALRVLQNAADLQEDSVEVDKKLLKAVTDLTKTMQFGYKRQQEEKKKGLAGYVQGKISSVKSAFSLEGIAGMAGIQRDSGTLSGAVLGSVLQRKEKKQEEAAKKTEFIAKFGEFTERGRQLKEEGGLEAVTAEGEKRYGQLTAAEKDISELEAKQKQAKMFNGSLSKSDTEKLVSAQNMKKMATDYSAVEKPLGGKKSEDLFAGVAEGVKSEIATLSPEERQTLSTADPEYLKGVFEGALGSLTEVNEKQLDQLVALVRASTMSEEDRLEQGNKDNVIQSIQDPKEDKKKEEEGGGLMKTVMDFLTSGLTGLFGKLSGMITGALSSIAGLLGRGAAKAIPAVLNAGKAIVGGAAKAIPAVLGKGAAVVSEVAPKALGGLGKLGNFAKGALGKLGPVAMAGMAAYDAVSGFNEAGANLGIEGREATTGEKLSSAAGSALSGLTFGLLGKDTASKGIASLLGAGPDTTPVKAAVPARVIQSGELAQNKEMLDSGKEEAAAPSQQILNNSPTTIINNTTKSNTPRTPVRNTDVSYNNRLNRYFV